MKRMSTLLSFLLAVCYQGDSDAWLFPVSCGYPAVALNLNDIYIFSKEPRKNRAAIMSSVLDALWEDRDVRFDITAQ